MRRLAACLMLLLTLSLGAPRPAKAILAVLPDTFTNWEFTGQCALDCAGEATGVLVLKNYFPGTFPGTQFGPTNFVSFRYDSSVLHFASGGNWQLANVPPLTNSALGILAGNPLIDDVEYLTFQDTSQANHYFAFIARNGSLAFQPQGETAISFIPPQRWCVVEGTAAAALGAINNCAINGDFGNSFTFEQVPEPATLALLGAGLLGLGVARRRRG